jgi:hypothetical protein
MPLLVDDPEHQLEVLGDPRSPASLHLLDHAGAAQRAAGVRRVIPQQPFVCRICRHQFQAGLACSSPVVGASRGANLGRGGVWAEVKEPEPILRACRSVRARNCWTKLPSAALRN